MLRISGFDGTIIPVNPRGGTMFGRPVRRSLAELNTPADVVVIAIRPDLILEAVREAGVTGHRRIAPPRHSAGHGGVGGERDARIISIISATIPAPRPCCSISKASRMSRASPRSPGASRHRAGGGADRRPHRRTGAASMAEDAALAFADSAALLRVTGLRQLVLAAKGFGAFPQGIGSRVFFLSNSGGPGALATDEAEAQGLELPPLPSAMAARLRADLPQEAAGRQSGRSARRCARGAFRRDARDGVARRRGRVRCAARHSRGAVHGRCRPDCLISTA
jgi:hypothetical protein